MPGLILVSGTHGSGKSVLARLLGEALDIPVVSRDSIRAGIVAGRGLSANDASSLEVGRESVTALFAVLRTLAQHSVSAVADHPMRRGLSEADVRPLLSLAKTAVIHCVVPREVALRRSRERGTARIANVLERRDEAGWKRVELPLDIDLPLLQVKTVQGYDPPLDTVIEFCRPFVGRCDPPAERR